MKKQKGIVNINYISDEPNLNFSSLKCTTGSHLQQRLADYNSVLNTYCLNAEVTTIVLHSAEKQGKWLKKCAGAYNVVFCHLKGILKLH